MSKTVTFQVQTTADLALWAADSSPVFPSEPLEAKESPDSQWPLAVLSSQVEIKMNNSNKSAVHIVSTAVAVYFINSACSEIHWK